MDVSAALATNAVRLIDYKLYNPNRYAGFRLINGEGDGLPGLVVDVYNDSAVVKLDGAGECRRLVGARCGVAAHVRRGNRWGGPKTVCFMHDLIDLHTAALAPGPSLSLRFFPCKSPDNER